MYLFIQFIFQIVAFIIIVFSIIGIIANFSFKAILFFGFIILIFLPILLKNK